MSLNTTLARANRAKNDEFYTRLYDVELELRHYRNQFRGKTVLCNCDDPYESSFFQHFAMSFNDLGLKKLIAVSYTGSPVAGNQVPLSDMAGIPAGTLPKAACKIEITEVTDVNRDGAVNIIDVEHLLKNNANTITPLAGDGDFRSAECRALLGEADIVVTNPPFSLFREYMAQLVESGKQFLILGNMNAITYRELFRFIKDSKMWLGYHNGDNKWFRVPDDYTHTTTKSHIRINEGGKELKLRNTAWFTNLDHGRRHEDLELEGSYYTPAKHPAYTNYPAIEVSRVCDIPADYDGAMGVPITFLDQYNPDQFEILGIDRQLTGGKRFLVPDSKGKIREAYARITIRKIRRSQ
jgi:adenine-specific methyltransferase EcoRI-like protein